ncbi:MAG: hypothetical protein ACTSUD_09505 [Alphaproteobacteria bacterium]
MKTTAVKAQPLTEAHFIESAVIVVMVSSGLCMAVADAIDLPILERAIPPPQ